MSSRPGRRQAWLAPLYLAVSLAVIFPEAASRLTTLLPESGPLGIASPPPLILDQGPSARRAEAEHERHLARLSPEPAPAPKPDIKQAVPPVAAYSVPPLPESPPAKARAEVPIGESLVKPAELAKPEPREPAGKKIADSRKAAEDTRVIAARMAREAEDRRRAEEQRLAEQRRKAEETERQRQAHQEAERERIVAADRAAENLIGDLDGTRFTLSFDNVGVAEGFAELVDDRGGAYLTPQFPEGQLEKYQFGKRVLYFKADELEHPVLLPRDLSREVLNRIKSISGLRRLRSVGRVHVRLGTGGEISGVEVMSLAQLEEARR